MTLKALVLEDEPLAQRYLTELLVATESVEVLAAVGDIAQADALLASASEILDVVFVDIRLVDVPSNRSGLDWARQLTAKPGGPMVVFVTALPNHALEAFEAGAVDYLLKPLTLQRVVHTVARLLERRPSAPAPVAARLLARTANEVVFLPMAGVLAFEGNERLTYVHHDSGRFLVDLSLHTLEQQLPSTVLRTHRNWLVAFERVEAYGRQDGEAVLTVGTSLKVPVSRARSVVVKKQLFNRLVGQR